MIGCFGPATFAEVRPPTRAPLHCSRCKGERGTLPTWIGCDWEMTVRCPSAPIMRPNHCWTVLRVSILAALLLTLNVDSEDCEFEIRVRRNTVYETSIGEELRINCTVIFCNNSPPTVSWFKLGESVVPVNVSSSNHIKTEWKKIDDSQGISFLVFKKIRMSDSGEYQCQGGGSMGHNINVSVSGNREHTNITHKNDSNSHISDPEEEDLWMYVYTAAGIVSFVIIVIIISVISMHGCKGKPKKETQTDNQYMAIPMVEQPPPHASVQALSRGSPSEPPPRRSTRRKTPPSQPSELPLPRDNDPLYGRAKNDRERARTTVEEEEGSSLVYAALNHQLPARAAARPHREMEERSEYAAIRVKDY
ncbi:B- and T-lymphocyte attenuator-like isoform X2 [Acanthopagrus latus]|uniref:B- and T-lymphocyte attenuator-like isoform X2 n=1 Tax=Acanthopagrus latus TaxID=8177 RepID=UPI00187CA10B|nr:B- and T-lymphocyte attenuator-like isoform X2 [Acanthopagrus latus]